MKAIRKRPGKAPELINLENDGDAIMEELGGWIESVKLMDDLALLLNSQAEQNGEALGALIPVMHNGEPELMRVYGTCLIVGIDGDAYTDVSAVDRVLKTFLFAARYRRIDRKHNVWACQKCGHMERFEADGPHENWWDFCPSCGYELLKPMGAEA